MLRIFGLTFKSLHNRSLTVGLTVASIALSIVLLLGVEHVRREAQTNFTNTISGTDLIVGARTSPVQLLLASVFRLSDATNNIQWDSYEAISAHPAVAWSIPISLGDSHRGYRVVGTTGAYFEHFRYGRKQRLRMRQGAWFGHEDGAVLGSEVASKLGYRVGDEVVVAHGAGDVSFIEHDEQPFTVTGILAPTGTPVDRSVHVSLAGIDSIDEGMNQDHKEEDLDPLAAALAGVDQNHVHEQDEHTGHGEAGGHAHDHAEAAHSHSPGQITAFFVGLKSRAAALGVQRQVNEYRSEALTAAMPAAALQELWAIVGVVEKALLVVAVFVVLVGLCGMLVAIMTSLNERRREMAILRSVGARPLHVLILIVGEAGLVTIAGVASGLVFLYSLLLIARPLIAERLGLFIALRPPSLYELGIIGIVCVAGVLIGFVPGYRSYRYSLADGLMVKI
ncbi:MAG: ABC transporter permease [Planctomycetota bacterium]|jgi:putative ABC transport system permease protein